MPIPCGITTETLKLRVLSGADAGVYSGPWDSGNSRWDFGTVGGNPLYLVWDGAAWQLQFPHVSFQVAPDSAGCGPFLATWLNVTYLDSNPTVEVTLAADPASGGLALAVNPSVACGLFEAYPWPDMDVELLVEPFGTYRLPASTGLAYGWSAQIGGTDLYVSYPAPGWTYVLALSYDTAAGVFRLLLSNYAGGASYDATAYACNPLAIATPDFEVTQAAGTSAAGLYLTVKAAAFTVADSLPLVLGGLAADAGGLPLVLSGKEPLTSGLPLGVEAGTGVGVGLYLRGNNPAVAGLPFVVTSNGPVTSGLPVTVVAPRSTTVTSGLPIFLHTGSEVSGFPVVVQSEGAPAGSGMLVTTVGAATAAGGLPLVSEAVGTKSNGLPVYARGW